MFKEFYLELTWGVLVRIFLIFHGFYLERTQWFCQEPFCVLRVLSRKHSRGSIENLFMLQDFYLEHAQGVLLRSFLVPRVSSRTLQGGSNVTE